MRDFLSGGSAPFNGAWRKETNTNKRKQDNLLLSEKRDFSNLKGTGRTWRSAKKYASIGSERSDLGSRRETKRLATEGEKEFFVHSQRKGGNLRGKTSSP